MWFLTSKELKRLSGYEALLLQSLDQKRAEKLRENVADGTLLTQAGNAMTVTVVSAITKQLIKHIS